MEISATSAEDLPAISHVLGADLASFYQRRLSRPGCVLVSRTDGAPVGALCVSWEPAEEAEIRQHLPGVPMLYRLFVHPDHRCRGHASGLLAEAERLLTERGDAQVACGVDIDNHRVVRLYERLKYQEWVHGQIATFRELPPGPDGAIRRVPDRCRIFVKQLP